MSQKTLQDMIDEAGNATNLLRANKYDNQSNLTDYVSPHIIPAVPAEFSRWEREAMSWHKGVALFDLSHHMVGVYVKGPDAHKLLGYLSCNSLFKSTPFSASQIICLNEDGYMIGDGIVEHYEDGSFAVFGAPMVPRWVDYQAQVSGLNVESVYEKRTLPYANGHETTRPRFCYQIQGPLAGKLIEKLNGGPLGDVKFFGMTKINIAGQELNALRHGMAGAIGLEITGPWDKRDAVRDEIIRAGDEFGLTLVGGAAYLITAMESGWFQGVLPAIYEEEHMRAFREWLPANDHYAVMRLQGSKLHPTLQGYRHTPHDLGYGKFINYDHDFIGRDAIAAMDTKNCLKKVTLAWNTQDTADLFKEAFTSTGRNIRIPHLPISSDTIGIHSDTLTFKGQDAGESAYTAYSPAYRTMLSMALVNQDIQIGDEVVIGWGEAGGGYGKGIVPADDIFEIRARVSPTPYSTVAREQYRK